MNCPTCQTPNRDSARFCRTCGVWLLPRCPFCNAEILPASAFCDQCGRRISDTTIQQVSAPALPATHQQTDQRLSPSVISHQPLSIAQLPNFPIPEPLAAKLHAARESRAMEGQRRIVTMLFCDVKGSTEAASRFDPEEWAGIINGAFECMITPVYHYEGTVARLMGDGLLAFFGAPIAHEDDPQRAVLAGLEILENISQYKDEVFTQWEVEIDARVGINTGLVVVGAVGSDLQVEYSALGDAINIAARMEQTAMPGTVQISEETYRLITPLFEFEDLGFVQVKGKAETVHTYRPLRQKTWTGPSGPGRLRGIEGLESPTLGREKELATLQTALQNLSEHGVGRLVFLIGEAGIGKSRLIREIESVFKVKGKNSNSNSPLPLSWYEIAPLSFEASQPYAFFRSFLRQLTGIEEMASAEEARLKLTALSERLSLEVRGGVTGAFASLLGARDALSAEAGNGQPADGESFKRQLFATAREAVRVHFTEAPGVIIMDDLHWADPASLEIFTHLFPLVETIPILFLCATRPEREAPVWQLKTRLAEEYPHRFVEIPVQPLSPDDSNALVDHLLAVAELPPRIRAIILGKSEGNPFFLEEIIRTLIEDGSLVRHEDVAGDGQPHWHVAEEEISTIVIPDNLQSLLAARLDRLTEDTRRVVQMASVIGRTFYFRVLENITGTLNGLENQLATLQRMNMVIEAARLPELEYAFRHALLQETAYRSILRKQRREFHQRVGEAMEQLFMNRLDEYASILAMHFERGGDGTKALRYNTLAGDVAFRLYATTEAVAYYGKGIEIVNGGKIKDDGDGDGTSLSYLYLRKGRSLELSGKYEDALECYLEMEALAHARQDRSLELAALVARATVHAAPTGRLDWEQVERLSEQALTIAEALEDYAAQAKIYWNLMLVSFFVENMPLASEFGQKSLAIARQHNLREQLAYTLNDITRVYLINGQVEQGSTAIKESQALWRELGNKNMLADNLTSSGLIFMFGADYANAEKAALEALEISQEIGNLWGQSYSQYVLAFLYHESLEVDRALEVMQNSIRLGVQAGFVVPLVDTHVIMGLLYAFMGDFDKGLEYTRAAAQNAERSLRAFLGAPLSAQAMVHLLAGNLSAAAELLESSAINLVFNSTNAFLSVSARCYYLLLTNRAEEASDLIEQFIHEARTRNIAFFIGDAISIKGQALLALGQWEEARQTLMEARELASFSRRALIEILPALVKVETHLGNPSAASRFLLEAQQIVQYILDHTSDPALRASFLARPEIREILRKQP